MKPALAVAIAAAAAIGAYFVGRTTASPAAPAAPPPVIAADTTRVDADRLAAAREAARAEAAAKDAALGEVESLRARIATLEAEAQAARDSAAAAAATATAGNAGKPAPAGKERRIYWGGGEYEQALRSVDWKSVGDNMHAMVPLLRDLGAKLLAGEQLPPETIGKIQQHNGPLVTAALKLGAAIPGTGPNGKFSDPGFMSNAIASALEASGLPLSEQQAAALERAAKDFAAQDEQRRNAYDAATPELLKILEEVELKDRFFDAAFALLRPDQAEALTPSEVRHRIHGDIFSGALVWAGRAGATTYADDADLATKAVAHVRGRLRLAEAQTPHVRAAVDGWIASIPESVRSLPMDGLTKLNLIPNDHVCAWARQNLALFQAVERAVTLDDAGRERLRTVGSVAVMYRSATPAEEEGE